MHASSPAQGDFEPLPRDTRGFAWKAERPDADSFLSQKWGWTASEAGSWVDLVLDTRTEEAAAEDSGDSPEAAAAAAAAGPPLESVAYLGYLRSYEGMGSATVECIANCTCGPTVLEGTWERKASLTQFHTFEARAGDGHMAVACCARTSYLPRWRSECAACRR